MPNTALKRTRLRSPLSATVVVTLRARDNEAGITIRRLLGAYPSR